jgi:hypothetical protein
VGGWWYLLVTIWALRYQPVALILAYIRRVDMKYTYNPIPRRLCRLELKIAGGEVRVGDVRVSVL